MKKLSWIVLSLIISTQVFASSTMNFKTLGISGVITQQRNTSNGNDDGEFNIMCYSIN